MNKLRLFYFIFYFISLVFFYSEVDESVWFGLSLAYFPLLILTIFTRVKVSFPFCEFIILIIFIQFVFCMVILLIFDRLDYEVNMSEICSVDPKIYLPFVFLTVQSIYIGNSFVRVPYNKWKIFYSNYERIYPVKLFHLLLVIGLCTYPLSFLNFSFLNYPFTVIKSLVFSAIIGLSIYNNYKYKVLIIGFSILLISYNILSGMIGESFISTLFLGFLIIVKRSLSGKKIYSMVIIPIIILFILILSFFQNIKNDYRTATWSGQEKASSSVLYDIGIENKEIFKPTDYNFYTKLLYRLNQSGITSEVLNIVPLEVPYANGATIIQSVIDAFVPRILNPNKEKAGGVGKYEKYTGRFLDGGTSMNIGIFGEGYINFGPNGCIVLFIFFGILVAYVEIFILNFGSNSVLILFTSFFMSVLGSPEGDFMILLNGLVKGTIILIVIIKLTPNYYWTNEDNFNTYDLPKKI